MTRLIPADGRTIELSRPEKPLFPGGITKGDLAAYYAAVAPVMLPHLRGRPLVMERFPDGIGRPGFYEKRVPDHFPAWIPRVELPLRGGGSITHVLCDNPAVLVYLAEQACITPHPWLSRADQPELPDRIVFDLDPPERDPRAAFPRVRWAARRLRDVLDELALPAYVTTSGSKGLHVYVPLERAWDFDAVRSFARRVADLLAKRHPDRLTTAVRKQARGDALFVDVLRNGYGQTAVAPYAVRARTEAPVATPLAWEELARAGMHAQRYTLRSLPRRRAQRPDPWADIEHHAVRLDEAHERLRRLTRRAPARRAG